MVTQRVIQKGFTIVELLIVIVVIGILAAITIVTYNGVQQRALNSARTSSAVDFQNLIRNYVVTNGAYPASSSFCLNGAGADNNADGVLDCKVQTSIFKENSTLTGRLATIGSLPEYPDNPVTVNSTNVADGIGYSYSAARTIDGAVHPVTIVYNLDGNARDCNIVPILHSTGVANAYTTDGTTNYYSTNATSTYCMTTVPDPAEL